MLITNKNYTKEAKDSALKVYNFTLQRHSKWIINQKYHLDQNDVDTIFSRQSEFCDSVIIKEEERISDNQRLLLECEAERVYDKRKEYKAKVELQKTVLKDVAKHLSDAMSSSFKRESVDTFFHRFPDFNHFLATAYSPSLVFSQLENLITNDSQLRANVLDLVNNPLFSLRLGKAERTLDDAKVAIGRLGIDNSRLLFPILMAKPLLRWSDDVTKSIAPKLWQDMIITANVSRLRLQQIDAKNPEQGILMGVLRSLSKFVIVNRFPQMFEDSLVSQMQRYRDQGKHEEYYTCADIKPDVKMLPGLIEKLEGFLTRKIVDHIEWNHHNNQIKEALIEHLDEKPIIERCEFGKALGQATAYSMFDTLDRSKAFIDKHKPYLFAHVQMPMDVLRNLSSQNRGRVELIT
ncbi:HDOD domain-containing protein [Vibrio maerlii]|uniref:HDOD domain-containing protein n=1 Tax=Vibrio maerlii TaxID=2231648 RepID=UPI000E3C5CC2|nr:HDOD domain-containing protein [Vibrio maerlii]